jgi:uncharacterized membrane protein
MGGIIEHLIFALISSAIVYYNFKKLQYSVAIFVGNFLHDVFIMAYAPFLLKTINPMEIIGTSLWLHRDPVFNVLWMIFQAIFIGMFLFFQKYIRKKEFKELEYNMGFLLLGIITHAVIDMMIVETGIWV